MNKHYGSISCLKKKAHPQSGSALILAIFIIVVLSLLGSTLVTLQRGAINSASYDVYATRAHLAAYSVKEIALENIQTKGFMECKESKQINVKLSNIAGFNNCDDTFYTCYTNASSVGTLYTIVSSATCGHHGVKVRRVISTKVND